MYLAAVSGDVDFFVFDHSCKSIRDVFDVNLFGALDVFRAFLPLLEEASLNFAHKQIEETENVAIQRKHMAVDSLNGSLLRLAWRMKTSLTKSFSFARSVLQRMTKKNVFSNDQLVKKTDRDMKLAPRVIIVGSALVGVGLPGMYGYVSSKWALRGAVECIRKEIGAHHVLLCIVEPGGIRDTSLFTTALSGDESPMEVFDGCNRRVIPSLKGSLRTLLKYLGTDARQICAVLEETLKNPCPKSIIRVGFDAFLYPVLQCLPPVMCDFIINMLCFNEFAFSMFQTNRGCK